MNAHGPIMQPLGRFYMVECQSRTHGAYLCEVDNLPRGTDQTEADALELLNQNEDAIAIYKVEEGRFEDVSKEMAELMLDRCLPDHEVGSDFPAFVQRHFSPHYLDDVEDELASDRRHTSQHEASLRVAS